MSNKIWMSFALTLLSACSGEKSAEQSSKTSAFLVDLPREKWSIENSPYILPPGSTIAVCDTGVKEGVADLVAKAARIWADVGGRDERLKIVHGCSGDHIFKLVRVPNDVTYYGQVAAINGNVHRIDVPEKWAGHWTANHEVGHIFGFAHILERTVSIMNSDDNGIFMNGGKLSSYDLAEVKKFLQRPEFAHVNKLWAGHPSSTLLETPVMPLETASPEEPRSCTGTDGETIYPHGTVTTYKGNTFTCDQGKWNFSEGLPETTPAAESKSCTGTDGETIYSHGAVTTYKGNTFTCDQGKWNFSEGT